jgi:hypothetical protein
MRRSVRSCWRSRWSRACQSGEFCAQPLRAATDAKPHAAPSVARPWTRLSPVAVRGNRRLHRPSWRPDAVRYTSVDSATQRSTALHDDTRRDQEETARTATYPQLAGRFRRVWQVVDSNHRRRSRRFYSPLASSESYATDLRLCGARWDCGPPPSAMRPCVAASGRCSARTGTDGGGESGMPTAAGAVCDHSRSGVRTAAEAANRPSCLQYGC